MSQLEWIVEAILRRFEPSTTTITGIGFLVDAYVLFSINLVNNVLEKVYPDQADEFTISAITSSVVVGTLIGQLLFGMVADQLGRKLMFVTTMALVIVGTLGSSLLSWNVWIISVFFCLGVWRLILGVGLGGEYPLTAIITSEFFENDANRGARIAGVFSLQGWGKLVAPMILYLLLIVAGNNLDLVWRLALGLGAIPAFITFWPRLGMHETKAFMEEQRKNEPINWRSIFQVYWRKLLGTCSTWFLLDSVLYANGLFTGTLLETAGLSGNDGEMSQLMNDAKITMIVAFIGLPGHWLSIYLIDRWGRRTLQMWGFALMTVLYMVLGGFFDWVTMFSPAFIFLYGLTYFIANAGPNTTTYVLPAEVFPTKIRSTCHGLSAACGKAGAAIGTIVMGPMLEQWGVGVTLMVCGGVCAAGYLMTVLFVDETVGKTLEELSEEDDELTLLFPDPELADRLRREERRLKLVFSRGNPDAADLDSAPLTRLGLTMDSAKLR